jgi:hypothetical protein
LAFQPEPRTAAEWEIDYSSASREHYRQRKPKTVVEISAAAGRYPRPE